jgi:hypothetical protein
MAKYRTVHCDSCEVLVVNNVICHEQGCPDAWKDEIRSCKCCGTKFKPTSRDQYFDDDTCAEAYNS